MSNKLKKSLNDALVLAKALRDSYKASLEDREKVTPKDILSVLDLIICKLEETKVLTKE